MIIENKKNIFLNPLKDQRVNEPPHTWHNGMVPQLRLQSRFESLAFVLDGFDNWKKALEKLESYQQTKCHKEAVEKHAASKRSQVNTQLDTHYRLNQSVRQIGLITFFVFSVLHIATRTSC